MKRYQESITVCCFIAMIAGLLLAENSPVVLSISMIALTLNAILTTPARELFVNFWQRKDLLVLSISYLYLVTSFLYSDHTGYLMERLQIKVPFLVLPFAAASLAISVKSYHRLLLVFFIVVVAVSGFTFINYLIHYDEITASYLKSKIMPGPVNHIRFSIMVAFAAYLGFHLSTADNTYKLKQTGYLLISGSVFLALFLHVYAVRSGIIALYAIIIIRVAILIVRQRAYLKGIAAIGVLCILAVSAILLSPTLRNKIQNTKEDLQVYRKNQSANFNSISTRLVSYEIALAIFKQNKLFGCGLGDLESENLKLYKETHAEIDVPIIPHNQFIYYLAAIGLIGTIVFTFCFFSPIFYNGNSLIEPLLLHFVVLFLSFQTEPMLETQLGVGYSILFIILPLMVKRHDQDKLRSF